VIREEGLLSLESCCGRPKMRNSVLEELRDIGRHPVGYVSYSVSRWVMLREKSRAENYKRNGVSSA